VVAAIAKEMSPLFSVVSHDPGRLEAILRFRVPAASVATAGRLKESLKALQADLSTAGYRMGLDETLMAGRRGRETDVTVFELSFRIDPRSTTAEEIGPALSYLARVLEETRLGDHVMEPGAWWLPEQLA
jgi:hypothetical protein